MTRDEMIRECVTPNEIVRYMCEERYDKGREDQTKRIFDELFELLEGPAYNQCLLITYQALKDMYREYMEEIEDGRRMVN